MELVRRFGFGVEEHIGRGRFRYLLKKKYRLVIEYQQALSSEAAFSVKQFVNTRISAAMSRIGRSDVDALTKTERRRIIELLAQESLFTVKGCVNMTAKLLNVSVPTIYRYINSAKEDNA